MALCGGKAISRLVKLGLIMVSPGDFKDGTSIYRITGDGRNTLSKMEQENKDE
jgi:predicted transcriptional regulator with HTH domain